MAKLLDRRWMLSSPEAKVQQIVVSSKEVKPGGELFGNVSDIAEKENEESSFHIVRDDLSHPLVNGNKSRKLDGLLPLVEDHLVTHVVSFSILFDRNTSI